MPRGRASPANRLDPILLRALTLKIRLHQNDLPEGLDFGDAVAVDTETMGLNPARDRLCLVQLSAGDEVCHLVQLTGGGYDAPRLKALRPRTSNAPSTANLIPNSPHFQQPTDSASGRK